MALSLCPTVLKLNLTFLNITEMLLTLHVPCVVFLEWRAVLFLENWLKRFTRMKMRMNLVRWVRYESQIWAGSLSLCIGCYLFIFFPDYFLFPCPFHFLLFIFDILLIIRRRKRRIFSNLYHLYIYTLGMGRFPDSLGASATKVNDAMHRFKKCASDTSWHLYCDASFLTYLHW